MAKIKGMCRNEDCEMCDQIQEAEKSNFKCEQCGRDLIPFGNKTKETGGGPNKKLIGIISGVVAVLAIIGGVIAFGGGGDEAPKQEPVAAVPVDSDSIRAAQLAIEQQHVRDSLQAVADSLAALAANTAKPQVDNPAPSQRATTVQNARTKDLGYASFVGTWPNDVNGRLVFKADHQIDSRDPKARMAEAGDYVIGEFIEGHLVQGIWYGADGVVKGSIIIGQ